MGQVSPIDKILFEKNWFDLKTLKESEANALRNHIEVHRYLLCKEANADISWLEAIESWFLNVWEPISRVAELPGLLKDDKKTKLEHYLGISEHWHYMKQKNPLVTPKQAVEDYAKSI